MSGLRPPPFKCVVMATGHWPAFWGRNMNKEKVSNVFLKLNIVFSVIVFIVLLGLIFSYFAQAPDEQYLFLILSFLTAVFVNPLGFIFGILSLCFDNKYKRLLKMIFLVSSITLEIIFLCWPVRHINYIMKMIRDMLSSFS